MRRAEGIIKNLIIFLLLLTALYLLLSNMAGTISGITEDKSFIPKDKLAKIKAEGVTDVADFSKDRISPVFIAVSASSESRGGVAYDDIMLPSLYTSAGKVISELFSDTTQLSEGDISDWKACFDNERYIYFDYGNEYLSGMIDAFIEGEASCEGDVGSVLLSELFIVFDSGRAYGVSKDLYDKVYIFTPDESYFVGTEIFAYNDRAELVAYRLQFGENGTEHEIKGTVYTNTASFSPRAVKSGKADEEFLSPLFKMLGYNVNNLSGYYDPLTETSYYIGENGESLSVDCVTNKISYYYADGLDLKNAFSGDDVKGLYDYLSYGEKIIAYTDVMTEVKYGKLCLLGANYGDGGVVLSYGYRISGIPVQLSSPALSLRMQSGRLIGFELIPISAELTGEMTVALPKNLLNNGDYAAFAYFVDELNGGPVEAQWRYGKKEVGK